MPGQRIAIFCGRPYFLNCRHVFLRCLRLSCQAVRLEQCALARTVRGIFEGRAPRPWFSMSQRLMVLCEPEEPSQHSQCLPGRTDRAMPPASLRPRLDPALVPYRGVEQALESVSRSPGQCRVALLASSATGLLAAAAPRDPGRRTIDFESRQLLRRRIRLAGNSPDCRRPAGRARERQTS